MNNLSQNKNLSFIGLTLPKSQSGKLLKKGATACIKDGEIKFASAEERFTRNKYDNGFQQSLLACLQEQDLQIQEIDKVVASTCCDSVWTKKEVRSQHQILSSADIAVISHHLSHAYSAFIPSYFSDAIILVVDAGGNLLNSVKLENNKKTPWSEYPREQLTAYRGEESDIALLERDFAEPNEAGIGEVYRAFTHYLGWPSHTYSAHTMALAAYGDASQYQDLQIFEFDQGMLTSNVKNDPNRPKQMVRELAQNQSVSIPPHRNNFPQIEANNLPDEYAHLAARLQDEVEAALIRKVNYLVEKTGLSNLCISGGVGLNCVANRKILDNTKVQDIFIQPAAGDTGQALGNALCGYCDQVNYFGGLSSGWFSPYLGRGYDLSFQNIQNTQPFSRLSDHGEIEISKISNAPKRAVELIGQDKVIGWFQGRSEYGPRALGNRSILADPRSEQIEDRCRKIKGHREPYRPFSPSVIREDASEYFDIKRETPYMIMVSNVKPGKASEIPAVVHVDSTSRLQTVTKEQNKKFYNLLSEFKRMTDIPMVLNTSLNPSGDPIVETPADALKCYLQLNLDALVIGDVLVE